MFVRVKLVLKGKSTVTDVVQVLKPLEVGDCDTTCALTVLFEAQFVDNLLKPWQLNNWTQVNPNLHIDYGPTSDWAIRQWSCEKQGADV